MAFSSNRGPSTAVSEINVTPLVDVMLVLLIIFMISAPLLQSGVEITLPEGSNELSSSDDYVILAIDADGKFYLNNKYLQPEVLLENVQTAVAASPDKIVYIHGDKNTTYGTVANMLDRLRAAGIERVSLVTDPSPVETQ